MNEIELFNNNKREIFDPQTIFYNEESMLITRETLDMKIILDFKNKECSLELKEEGIKMAIPVLLMDTEYNPSQVKMAYILASAPQEKKTIIITKK